MSTILKGIAASSGIAIGKAFRLVEPDLSFEKIAISDADEEINRLHSALDAAKSDLKTIRDHAMANLGEDKAAIFDAHLLVLSDPELIGEIEGKVRTNKVNSESALKETTDQYVSIFEQMDNEYMKERAADIKDVSKRILAHLLGVQIQSPSMVAEEVIIVAEDLTPSDTAQLNKQFVRGFTTNIGGRTSHSAIMARSLEIPAVVGTKTITSSIQDGDLLVVDGMNGEVHVNPTSEAVQKFEEMQKNYEQQKAEWALLKNEATVTSDGVHLELAANIGSPNDIEAVLKNGGEAVGLYRTEFLFMERDQLPSEDEQFEAYKTVLEKMEGRSVVVRTLDIGGDKKLPYLQLPDELNPFLGIRAIRLCLEEQDLFRTQLRALLRASIYGKLRIMFPMIATLDEFQSAKKILLEEKQNLLNSGIKVSDDIEIGIMVEIPSTAVLADQLAKEVDFFSIGTNDLIQYTMAADRMNERVSYLYQPYNPAILRLVKMVIDGAHAQGKWAGMCGEMAGDELAIPLLVGLGLDEFSMSASSILKARNQIKHLDQKEMKVLAEKALSMQTAGQVVELVKKETEL
ncbi:phosphoenolpyruvate--protein phosphotransferase [Bacillus niameyensis]|uniref:phosphoenolpyruvate--protein phosphotransferase n=1 Tax=Bacillus niameyensis TaxID=1522308 RepID=UPI00078317C2|nr:phosphoenolpyruvate--protein phosphotransferase [Bacillus niameyensis]